ncbi:MAG: hypothetical protein K0S88_645 [Actinomycetia bacterium]|nr:hypothetical protein [Actinomycetes bacterium]
MKAASYPPSPAAPSSAASTTRNRTRSATPASAASRWASVIEASSESIPSTRSDGNALASEMLDQPIPQPTSSTRAPSASRRASSSGTAANHPARSLTNMGRLKLAMASRQSAPYSG